MIFKGFPECGRAFFYGLTPIEKEKDVSPNIQINLIRLKIVIMLLN